MSSVPDEIRAGDHQEHDLPVERVARRTARLPDEEEHAGDEIGAKTEHAPRQQAMHVRERHLLHHAEDPQIHGQQHTERQRQAEEVHRLRGGPHPTAVHHELIDRIPRHEAFRIAPPWLRRLQRRESQDGESRRRDSPRGPSPRATRSAAARRGDRNEPARRGAAAPPLPQRDPGNEAGELHPGESKERHILVDPDRVVGDFRTVRAAPGARRRRSRRREASGPQSRRALPGRHASGARCAAHSRVSSASATTDPTVGTWFRSRCR